jgi:hypothetical protein
MDVISTGSEERRSEMPSRKSSGQAGKERDWWTPIRRGKIYCSPGCGRGCTVAEHDEAVAAGERLVHRLKGKGWHAIIHENMGWHYRAVSGPVSIYCSEEVDGPRYWCLMSDDPNKGGYGCPLWDEITEGRARRFKDPNDAVKDIVARASKVISKLFHAVIAAREAAGMSTKAADVLLQTREQRKLLLPASRVRP